MLTENKKLSKGHWSIIYDFLKRYIINNKKVKYIKGYGYFLNEKKLHLLEDIDYLSGILNKKLINFFYTNFGSENLFFIMNKEGNFDYIIIRSEEHQKLKKISNFYKKNVNTFYRYDYSKFIEYYEEPELTDFVFNNLKDENKDDIGYFLKLKFV